MNFANILLHQHDLYETREDKITSEMSFRINCIAYSLRNGLACFVSINFFSLRGRDVRALRRTPVLCAMTLCK